MQHGQHHQERTSWNLPQSLAIDLVASLVALIAANWCASHSTAVRRLWRQLMNSYHHEQWLKRETAHVIFEAWEALPDAMGNASGNGAHRGS